jgi:hypothetical protein
VSWQAAVAGGRRRRVARIGGDCAHLVQRIDHRRRELLLQALQRGPYVLLVLVGEQDAHYNGHQHRQGWRQPGRLRL